MGRKLIVFEKRDALGQESRMPRSTIDSLVVKKRLLTVSSKVTACYVFTEICILNFRSVSKCLLLEGSSQRIILHVGFILSAC